MLVKNLEDRIREHFQKELSTHELKLLNIIDEDDGKITVNFRKMEKTPTDVAKKVTRQALKEFHFYSISDGINNEFYEDTGEPAIQVCGYKRGKFREYQKNKMTKTLH